MTDENSPPAKRRRLSPTDEVVSLLGPSRSRPSAVLPRRCPPRPEVELAATASRHRGSGVESPIKRRKKASSSKGATPGHVSPSGSCPRMVDSPLTSENIEKALRLIDKNTRQKRNSSDDLLQVFHDLYRWSRLPNRDHRNFFLHEFVWELSGISRVMRFLKAHGMGETFLCQLLQTELPFNE